MLMLNNEAMGRLAVASSMPWYGQMLRREDGHVLTRELEFEVGDERRKGRLKRKWKKQVEEESMKVDLRREGAFYYSKWNVGVHQIATRLR